jgi:hypothetical protein
VPHSAGPTCDLSVKTHKVISDLTRLRLRISRSPDFMLQRAPYILWALTLATQDFFAESITASQFKAAEDNDEEPPVVYASIDVANLSKLQLTEACDLPVFLRHHQSRPAHVPHSTSPYIHSANSPTRTPAAPSASTGRHQANNPPTQAPVNDTPQLSPAFARLFSACSAEKHKTIGLS